MIETARVKGIEMNYFRFGKGKDAFVILPGLSFKPVTPFEEALKEGFREFGERFTVYLFDRRSNLPDEYSIDDMARDTVEVMKSLGLKNVCIFGASLGGMVAQTIAAEYPGFVKKMVICSTLSESCESISNAMEIWTFLAENGRVYEANELMCRCIYGDAVLKEYGEGLIDSGRFITADEGKRFAKLGRTIISFNLKDRIKNIKCDVLVAGSEGDRLVPPDSIRETASLLNCEMYMYGSEYGHAVYDEAPDFRPRMLEFLTR